MLLHREVEESVVHVLTTHHSRERELCEKQSASKRIKSLCERRSSAWSGVILEELLSVLNQIVEERVFLNILVVDRAKKDEDGSHGGAFFIRCSRPNLGGVLAIFPSKERCCITVVRGEREACVKSGDCRSQTCCRCK